MYERSRNLLDCHIAGFAYYDGLEVISELKLGTPVELKAEVDNPYDPEAMVIYFAGKELGYVPQTKNGYISNLLYFGYSSIVEAKISYHNPEAHSENQFHIVIKIIDSRKS